MVTPTSVTILGSTGSIGQNTLDVIARHPSRFVVHALTAHSRMELLAKQAYDSKAAVVAVPTEAAAERFKTAWGSALRRPTIRVGAQALVEVASDPASQAVMAAIVGSAGLPAALAAAQAGKRVDVATAGSLSGTVRTDAQQTNTFAGNEYSAVTTNTNIAPEDDKTFDLRLSAFKEVQDLIDPVGRGTIDNDDTRFSVALAPTVMAAARK